MNINENLEKEKRDILKAEGLQNKVRSSAWDKVVKSKVVHVRIKPTDRAIELTKKMPMLSGYSNYKENLINMLDEPSKEKELANFFVNSTNDELKFFLSQMVEDGGTSWFVFDYCFKRPNLHSAINTMMEQQQYDKVRTMFAFAFDDILELRLTKYTHPNSFSAYAENRCGQEISSFLDTYLNQNAIIFNDYLTNVQNECMDYKTPKEFFDEIATYNDVKQYDYDNLISTPNTLFKAYLLFKKLNERKVWDTDIMLSINEFIERDKKRAMYDDFDNTKISEVQRLYDEIIR